MRDNLLLKLCESLRSLRETCSRGERKVRAKIAKTLIAHYFGLYTGDPTVAGWPFKSSPRIPLMSA